MTLEDVVSTIMNIPLIGYGTMCDQCLSSLSMWEVPIMYSNTYRAGARFLIEILIEKISHFNIAYWDCLIKSYTLNMGRGVKYWKTSPEENIY